MHTLELYKRKIIKRLTGVVHLAPSKPARGNALLSYMTLPFLRNPSDRMFIAHTNAWECMEIAHLLLRAGYRVDVIDWNNTTFIPKKKYDVFVDLDANIERLASTLGPTCVKIFHVTGTHWLFQNTAEQKRINDLQDRRGIILSPNRASAPNKNIEYADAATVLGEKSTSDTFAYAGKDLYSIPISTPRVYDFPTDKNWSEAKKRFVWFGGTGFVHKGLDLVLEAFSKLPEYHLTVIGPIKKEKEFEEAFTKELYNTPNIETKGWMSIDDPDFIRIMGNVGAIVYPSCSEGQPGAVITAMHLGVLPIVSYESSIPTLDFGILLPNSSVESITEAIQSVAHMEEKELEARSKKTWEYARAHHTRDTFSKAYAAALEQILKKKTS